MKFINRLNLLIEETEVDKIYNIYLSDCELTKKVIDKIGQCSNLEILNLYRINLDFFPESWCNLLKLKSLGIHDCNIYQLPNQFCNMNLEHLTLDCSTLTLLPYNFGNLQLRHLELNAKSLICLPYSFYSLPINGLTINHWSYDRVPEYIRFLPNVSNICFYNSEISEFPLFFTEMPNLTFFSFDDCAFDWTYIIKNNIIFVNEHYKYHIYPEGPTEMRIFNCETNDFSNIPSTVSLIKICGLGKNPQGLNPDIELILDFPKLRVVLECPNVIEAYDIYNHDDSDVDEEYNSDDDDDDIVVGA